MEVYFLLCGGVFLVVLLTYFLLFKKQVRRKINEEEGNGLIVPPLPNSVPDVRQETNHLFTLAELKQAEEGRYSWDDTGCVFEINSDGSVTIVGHFDPAELLVAPVQEMIERLNDECLIEMLPKMWSLHAVNSIGGENDTFVVAWGDDILSVPTFPHTVDGVKEVHLNPSSFDGGRSVIIFILSKTGDGYMTLMPSNEKEYILSIGAKACVERAFGNKVKVKISSPAVMGAFGIAVIRTGDNASKISFAFGEGDDYMCCNLHASEGVYEVQNLLHSSIIQPIEVSTALLHIAKGCITQSLICEGYVKNCLLRDKFPYTMSLLLKENGRVVRIYDCISEPISIPTRQGNKDINVDNNKILSFLIGSNELIEDVISECNAPNGKFDAFVELDSEMGVMIKVSSNTNDYKINVGELIG